MSDCIFIAAGGTGGHIYPAIAIADAYKKQDPNRKVYFVGTAEGLENKIVKAKGYSILHVPVGRLNSVPMSEKLLTLLKLPLSLVKSFQLLRKYKPGFVLGVGGFASGPILLIASVLKIPTAIWEPNAMPGFTNRILSRFVDECFVVFESAGKHLGSARLIPSGMPVREEIENAQKSTTAPHKQRLLVFGGSQGSKALNTLVVNMICENKNFIETHEVVHQTGANDFARVQKLYGPQLAGVELNDYLHDMEKRYAWADVVISRAGAASVAELAACGKAAILIPLPTAADNHQQKNAEALVQKDAAIMILQKDLTPQVLRSTLHDLELNPERRRMMEEKIASFHHPRAAAHIVTQLLPRVQ